MKRLFIECVFLAAAASCALALPGAASAAVHKREARLFPPTPFDGTYSVQVITQDGDCGNSHWTVRIKDGQVASISPNKDGITANGIIEHNGVVSLGFQNRQNQLAEVGGKAGGGQGHGTWSSPTAFCGGIWRARRLR